MRYIPDATSNVIVQVPEDKNSYINVRNIGASGRGDVEFSGVVSDVSGSVVTINRIVDQDGKSLSQYNDVLKQGVEIRLFSYSGQNSLTDPQLLVTGHSAPGAVDFSNSSATNSNLAQLTYYVFGFDINLGILQNFRSRYVVGTKILNPDLWNTEQYVQLNMSRTSPYVIPVIYRTWGTRVDFLGIIGNNKVGYPGSGSVIFRDLGSTEIPSWESPPVLPSFLSDMFTVSAGEARLVKVMNSKETLRILPKPVGTSPNYLQCEGLSQDSLLKMGDTVKFYIDDTKFIQTSILTAAQGQIKDVFFPAGVYNIRDTSFSNSLQVDFSNISIRGVGAGSIISRLPVTISNPLTPGLINFTGEFDRVRGEGIRFTSMAFDGNRSGSFSSVSPITSEVTLRVENCDNLSVIDCTFYDSPGGAISVVNSKIASLNGNKITRTGRAYETPVSPFLIDTSENIVVQGNLMEFATTGPKIISTEYSTINGNIIRACGDRGLILETSSQWNAQGNLAYSDNDSVIRSIDTYNNEYSRATIEVRRGFSLDPVFMTVSYGGESVKIAKGSVQADIYALGNDGLKTGLSVGSFRVLETFDQLQAGIFSLTLPGGTNNQTVGVKTIIATGNLDNPNGYMYEVKADVSIGSFRPLSIRPVTIDGSDYFAIQLRNSSDILGFQIYSSSDPSQNDSINISGFDPNESLNGWDENGYYPVIDIEVETNSILIPAFSGLPLSNVVQFSGGTLTLLRPDYFVADGNLLVHTL